MQDPILNTSLEETLELRTRWSQFREFVRMAIERGKVTPEAEMKFLELKSIIAMLHDGFMAKLSRDQKTGQNIMSIVGDCIMLARIAGYNDTEKQKFEFDWNECYLLINEQVQTLEQEKQRLAGISERAYKGAKRRELLRAKIYNFIHSAGLRWIITAIAIFMALYGIPAFGIYNYRDLKDIAGVSVVYRLVANKIYRPFLSSDYAYDSWEDLDVNNAAPASMERIKKLDKKELNLRYLQESVLNEIGMTRPDAEEARKMLAGNKRHYEAERFTADGQDVRLFYVLFNTTEHARRFVDLANHSLNAPDLSTENKNRIIERVYMVRDANFVAIGISQHGMRSGQIWEKFNMSDHPSNALHI
jgi:hypothetical protein